MLAEHRPQFTSTDNLIIQLPLDLSLEVYRFAASRGQLSESLIHFYITIGLEASLVDENMVGQLRDNNQSLTQWEKAYLGEPVTSFQAFPYSVRLDPADLSELQRYAERKNVTEEMLILELIRQGAELDRVDEIAQGA